jgi:hypothetical protein
MRGNTFGALHVMLRRELGIAESPALGRNVRESHNQALQSAQARLFEAHDWPFKIITRDLLGLTGMRYYAPPEDLDLENLRDANVLVGSVWMCCERGIGIDQYNQVNSDAGARQDHVRRWNMYNDPDTNQDMIELWPVPATNNLSRVRFSGVKKLKPLVMNEDKADLDDLAIVLTAAADLANVKEKQQRQGKANQHVFSLVRNLSNGRTFVSGGAVDPSSERYRPPQIVISQ